MSVDVLPAPLPDAKPLYRLIRRTRRLLRSSWVLTGIGLTVGLVLGALVLTSLIDLVVPVWPTARLEIPIWWGTALTIPNIATALRVFALLLVVVPAGWAFLVGVVRPLLRRLSAENVARRIEAKLPGIHNRLVSAIDLDRAGRHQQRGPMSSVFYRKLLTEALERIGRFRPRTALDLSSLRRAGAFAMGSTLAFVLLWCLFSSSLPTAMARIFFPLADIPPVSGVAYDVKPASAEVLSKELVTFSADVTRGQADKLWLQVYAGKGPERAASLTSLRRRVTPRAGAAPSIATAWARGSRKALRTASSVAAPGARNTASAWWNGQRSRTSAPSCITPST